MEGARLTIRHGFQPGTLENELREQEGITVEVRADARDPNKETWIVDSEHQKLVFDWLTDHEGVTFEGVLHAH